MAETPPPRAPPSSAAGKFSSPRWATFEELGKHRTRSPASAGVKDRVKSITQRLSALQRGIDDDRKRARKALDARLEDLDKKFIEKNQQDEKYRADLTLQLEDLAESIDQERLARELLDERKKKEIEDAHKKTEITLEKFKQKRLEAEQSLSDQLVLVREAVETERKLRQESEERFGVHLGDEVARLAEEVKEESERRAQLEKQLEEETRAREADMSNIMQVLKDICDNMQKELLAERQERESTEETLLKLIEETCARVGTGGADGV